MLSDYQAFQVHCVGLERGRSIRSANFALGAWFLTNLEWPHLEVRVCYMFQTHAISPQLTLLSSSEGWWWACLLKDGPTLPLFYISQTGLRWQPHFQSGMYLLVQNKCFIPSPVGWPRHLPKIPVGRCSVGAAAGQILVNMPVWVLCTFSLLQEQSPFSLLGKVKSGQHRRPILYHSQDVIEEWGENV